MPKKQDRKPTMAWALEQLREIVENGQSTTAERLDALKLILSGLRGTGRPSDEELPEDLDLGPGAEGLTGADEE